MLKLPYYLYFTVYFSLYQPYRPCLFSPPAGGAVWSSRKERHRTSKKKDL